VSIYRKVFKGTPRPYQPQDDMNTIDGSGTFRCYYWTARIYLIVELE
jgi:hypothetical protein